MELRTQAHKKHKTFDKEKNVTGYLVPIYNIHEEFFEPGQEPKQVYLTVISPKGIKGPHLHYIRTGFFTCIKGDIRIIVKKDDKYFEYFSGENYEYLSIEVPKGTPAVLQNLTDTDAFVLNMPSPAWTPDMNDEHSADFSDYKF